MKFSVVTLAPNESGCREIKPEPLSFIRTSVVLLSFRACFTIGESTVKTFVCFRTISFKVFELKHSKLVIFLVNADNVNPTYRKVHSKLVTNCSLFFHLLRRTRECL